MILVEHEYHGVVVESVPEEVMQWLKNKFGSSGDRWFVKGSIDGTTVYFKDKRDHTFFLLTWCR
jgi:hypothetical protein